MAIRKLSFSASLVTQGQHRFFTLTMPVEDLATTCFVSTREDDVELGFQRTLDKKRAESIATYIDEGGVIPGGIVLSAQSEANLKYDSDKKTISFSKIPKAFLIIDGQHRIYGFRHARTSLRVPVVIFNNLKKKEESRLFIDINTKQRPVPNELLLDIRRLAEYERDDEAYIRQVFDLFQKDSESCLLGLMSPFERRKGKISRVTFKRAINQVITKIDNNDPLDVYKALNMYLTSFKNQCSEVTDKEIITTPTVFVAAFQFFPEASQKVSDKYKSYSLENYNKILSKVISKMKSQSLTNPGNPTKLYELLKKNFSSESLNFSF